MGEKEDVAADRLEIVIIEDEATAAELEVRELKRHGISCNMRRVENEEELRRCFSECQPMIVISDFTLPAFDGLRALEVVKEIAPDVPFIFVSGTIGEERAIEALKRGATDYVLKDNLARLAPSVQRALREARERRARREAEEALRASERRLRDIVASTQDLIWECDAGRRFTFVNPVAGEMLGYGPDELLGRDFIEFVHGEERETVMSLAERCAAERQGWRGAVFRWRHKDGDYRHLESNGIPLFDAQGRFIGFRGADRDITERIQQELRIKRLGRIRAVMSDVNAAIVRLHEREKLFQEVCRVAVEQGGFGAAWVAMLDEAAQAVRPAAWYGHQADYLGTLVIPLDGERPTSLTAQAFRTLKPVVCNDIAAEGTAIYRREEMLARGFRSMAILPLFAERRLAGVLGLFATEPDFFNEEEMMLLDEVAADLSFALSYIEQAERLRFIALYQPLTRLPNRSLFLSQIEQEIWGASEEARAALVAFDLEKFSRVNETLGRTAGDQLLQAVAGRLRGMLEGRARFGHLDGDRFVCLFTGLADDDAIAHLVERELVPVFKEPFTVAGHELQLNFVAGVALAPTDGHDADTLLQHADVALRRAKEAQQRFVFYTTELNERVTRRLTLENRLYRAFEREEFTLFYQPKIAIADRRMSGAEALLRWRDPEKGLVSPALFIPVLEETGLIEEVGRWVLRQAVEAVKAWRTAGLKPGRVAVNVSPRQLLHRDFVGHVADAVGDAEGARSIDLEITESMLMRDIDASIRKLAELREMGIGIALDDFGTGYSSLGQLTRLPIDTLKIDRSFISGPASDADRLAVVSTIVSLARALDLVAVAEGVETEEQYQMLRLLECDQCQGYLFSPPVDVGAFAVLLERDRWQP